MRCLAALLKTLILSAVAIAVADILLASTAISAADMPSATAEEPPERLPGLFARYTDLADQPIFLRYDAQPAFRLDRGEAPDPRLPKKNWRVVWTGVINVKRPGTYRFSATHSGGLFVSVRDYSVLYEGKYSLTPAGSKPIKLPFGDSKITIEFDSTDAFPMLEVFWESDEVPRERIPAHVFGHLKDSIVEKETKQELERSHQFVVGRLAVEEQNCVTCHRRSDNSIAEGLVSRPGPLLTNAGERLKAAWIYHWLGDPQALRPQAVMPRLFADDRTGEIERVAVATYLASQGGPLKETTDSIDAKAAGEGKQLFDRIGCIVCHEAHGTEPSRATLSRSVRKLRSRRWPTTCKTRWQLTRPGECRDSTSTRAKRRASRLI